MPSRYAIRGEGNNTNRAILIRVNNAADLARSQGSIASFFQSLAPATLEHEVLKTVASKLKSALSDQNVDAEVALVQPEAFVNADGSHIWSDVGIAVGTFGALAFIWHFFGASVKAAISPPKHHHKARR